MKRLLRYYTFLCFSITIIGFPPLVMAQDFQASGILTFPEKLTYLGNGYKNEGANQHRTNFLIKFVRHDKGPSITYADLMFNSNNCVGYCIEDAENKLACSRSNTSNNVPHFNDIQSPSFPSIKYISITYDIYFDGSFVSNSNWQGNVDFDASLTLPIRINLPYNLTNDANGVFKFKSDLELKNKIAIKNMKINDYSFSSGVVDYLYKLAEADKRAKEEAINKTTTKLNPEDLNKPSNSNSTGETNKYSGRETTDDKNLANNSNSGSNSAENERHARERYLKQYQQVINNVKDIEKNSDHLEQKMTGMVNQYFENAKYFKAWENLSKLELGNNTPDQLIRQYRTKVNEIQKITEEKKRSSTAQVNQMFSGSSLEQSVGETVNMINQMSADNREAKKKEELKRQLTKAFTAIQQKQAENNKQMIDQYNKAAAYALDQQEEYYYLNMANYLDCLNEDIDIRFTIENTDWLNPSYGRCREPNNSYRSNTIYNDSYFLTRAKDKFTTSLTNKKYSNEYLTTSKRLVDDVLRRNPSNIEALVFASKLQKDPIEKLLYISKAYFSNKDNLEIANQYKVDCAEFSNKLLTAVNTEDVAFIDKSIKYNFNYFLNTPNESGALEYTIQKDLSESFSRILRSSKSYQEKSSLYYLLVYASQQNAIKCMKLLMSYVRSADADFNTPITPLVAALQNNSTEAAKYLFSEGANIEANYTNSIKYGIQKEFLNALFESSIIRVDVNALEFVLKKNADYANNQALNYAVENSCYDCVRLLFQYNKNIKDDKILFQTSNLSIITLLNSNGLNVNQVNEVGNSVLYDAILKKDKYKARHLITLGADVNFSKPDNWSVLHLATYLGMEDCVENILAHDVDVNKMGPNGWTSLHFAARENNLNLVNLLLKNNADKTIKDKWGRTAYSIAKERELTVMKKALK